MHDQRETTEEYLKQQVAEGRSKGRLLGLRPRFIKGAGLQVGIAQFDTVLGTDLDFVHM